MNKDIIGIKLSDGSFYPVLTAGKASERQLKLTTARDGQTSIRLHLFRSAYGTMDDAEYIDSLRLDDIASHAVSEPTVTFSVSIDEESNISASLSDDETGNSTTKAIALDAVIGDMPDFPDFDIPEPEDATHFDVPPLTEEDLDFDIEDADVSPTASIIADISGTPSASKDSSDFSMQSSPFTDSSLYDKLDDKEGKKKTGISIPLAICIICAIICLCVLGIILFISPGKSSDTQEETVEYNFDGQLIPNQEDEIPSPYENIITVSEEPIIPVQPAIVEPEENENSTKIRHLVKWGDTLWDIADCYYKNPWAYPRIVKENNISNPDLIISGTILTIPR